jgi:hypothetical protein
MRPSWPILVALCLAITAVAAQAEDSPHAGTWRVVVLDSNPRAMAVQELSLWLVQIDREGKSVKVLASHPQFKGTASKFAADERGVRFTVLAAGNECRIAAHTQRGNAKVLLGSLALRGNYLPLRLERTSDKKIEEKTAMKVSPGSEDLQAAIKLKDKGEQTEALRAAVKKHAGTPVAIMAAQLLLQRLLTDKARPAEVKAAAESYVRLTAPYGPELARNTLFNLAGVLLSGNRTAALALDYARRGARKVADTDPPELRGAALEVLAEALRKNKKTDELKEVEEKLAKLDLELDRAFAKEAIPFKPGKSKGREGKRVVLVELFTGAQCPPCVAADIAFDALLKTYPAREVVLLQYHLHVPRSDPLTNEDSNARAKYYDPEMGTPTCFVDGKVTEATGGGRPAAKGSYDKLRKRIDTAGEAETRAKISLAVTRKGERIDVAATVRDGEKTDHTIKLRFALVEEMVRYPGSNGQRLHHHVVRAFPGGAAGFKVDGPAVKQTVRVDLAALRDKLRDYLAKHARENPTDPFTPNRRPAELKKLKVVAFVQDDDTKTIEQAAQVDVPQE